MTRVFLDTGYLIALESVNDQYHSKTIKHWQQFIQAEHLLVTSTFVFDEITTFFNNRNHHSKAVEIGENLITNPSIEIIHVDENIFNEGWKYFQIHQDKKYSFTDCISFILMKKNELKYSLTFDQHFEQAGFLILPSQY